MNIETITEDEAIDLHYKLSRRFGWGGTFFTRADAESKWQELTGDDLTNSEPLPDDVWENIRQTWYWRKGLTDSLTEYGWDIVNDAVAEAIEK